MTYYKLFPVSEFFVSNIIPEMFETDVYADNILKCAILELGACKALMNLKSPDSKYFWLGTITKELVEVLIIGWSKNGWTIKYNNKQYCLPYEHFIELKTIKAAPFN